MPLSAHIKNRVISYRTKFVENFGNDKITKLASKLYIIMHELHQQNMLKSQWLDNVEDYICSLGFFGMWFSQSFISSKWLIKSTHQKVKDIFIKKLVLRIKPNIRLQYLQTY